MDGTNRPDGLTYDFKRDVRWFLSRGWKGVFVVLAVLGLIFAGFNEGLRYVGEGKTVVLFGWKMYFPPSPYRIVLSARWLAPTLLFTFLIVANRAAAMLFVSRAKDEKRGAFLFDAFIYSGEVLSILAMKFSGGILSPLCLYFLGHVVSLSSVSSSKSLGKHIAFTGVLFSYVAISEYTGLAPHYDITSPPVFLYKDPAYFYLITLSVVGYMVYIGLGMKNVFRKFSERMKAIEDIESLAKFPMQSPNPVIRLDTSGVVVFANRSADFLMRAWNIRPGGRMPAPAWESASKSIETGGNTSFETEVEDRAYSFFVAHEPGKNYVTLYGADITDKKNAERALRETTERLELAYKAAGAGLWDWNIVTGRFEWTARIFELFGLDPLTAAVSFETWKSVVHPDDKEAAERRIKEAFVQRKVLNNEYRVVLPGGGTRWITAVGECKYDELGNPVRMIGVCTDSTERKTAEENNLLFRHLMDRSNDEIFIVDPETGRFLDVNAKTCSSLGYSKEEMLQMRVVDLDVKVLPDDHWLKLVDEIRSRGQMLFYGAHKRKDASVFPVEVGLTHLSLRDNEYIVAIARDITERENAEKNQARFFEQEKMATIGKVAGKMAHDFNNVLGVIAGTSELLKIKGGLSPALEAEIDIIIESAYRGKDLTGNLLVFAKDQEPKLSQFNLNDKIDLVVRSLKSDLRDMDVVLNYGSGMEAILADAGLLENALINIVQNSIHATSKTLKPALKIRTFCEEDNVCVEIEDNGCGIPAEHLHKIFDPTFTLKGGGDRTGAYGKGIKGSGYGMTNVKRFVEKHGGSVKVESVEGQGAAVTLKLPLIRGSFSAVEMEQVKRENVSAGKRILIVEDEPQLGRILYSILETFNHKIDLAADGRMALNNFRNNAYDIVSLDFILPDMTGIDVYRTIRETNRDVPVVFVSGNFEFMQSMVDLKKEDPKVDLLSKPFRNVDYVNAIHSWLPPAPHS